MLNLCINYKTQTCMRCLTMSCFTGSSNPYRTWSTWYKKQSVCGSETWYWRKIDNEEWECCKSTEIFTGQNTD